MTTEQKLVVLLRRALHYVDMVSYMDDEEIEEYAIGETAEGASLLSVDIRNVLRSF